MAGNIDNEKPPSTHGVVALMVLKYVLKFTGLAIIFPIIFYLLSFVYLYICKALTKMLGFLKTLMKLPKFKIFGIKITNYFAIIDSFIGLLIGVLYMIVALGFILATIFVSIFGSALMVTIK